MESNTGTAPGNGPDNVSEVVIPVPVVGNQDTDALSQQQSATVTMSHQQSHHDGSEVNVTTTAPSVDGDERSGTASWRTLSTVVASRGVIVTVAHVCMGIVLITVGCLVRSLVYSSRKDKQTISATSLGVSEPTHMLKPYWASNVIYVDYGPGDFPRSQHHNIRPIHPAALGDVICQALTCSPHFSLLCISAGCVFIFCACSGVLMIIHKMNEYVCCHMMWVSISALCSITLTAACIMGLKIAYDINRSLAVCTCTLIVASLLESIFCALDLLNVSNHFSERNSARRGRHLSWQSEGSSLRGNTGSSRNTAPERRAESIYIRPQRSNNRHRGESRSNHSERAHVLQLRSNRRSRSNQETLLTLGTRTGRNGQDNSTLHRPRDDIRDRNLLHPGHSQLTRQRNRRRPILRAQNHYVSVPGPAGRPRSSSRGRRVFIAADRRNFHANLPMFIIPNHDGDTRPSSLDLLSNDSSSSVNPPNTLVSQENEISTRVSQQQNRANEGAGSQIEVNHSLPEQTEERSTLTNIAPNPPSVAEPCGESIPLYEIREISRKAEAFDSKQSSKKQPGSREVYSVVRRSKECRQDDVKESLTSNEDTVVSPTLLTFQTTFAERFSRAAAELLEKQLSEGSGVKIISSCSAPPPTPDFLERGKGNPGETFLEDSETNEDGKTTSVENESSSFHFIRTCAQSVSSDSGLEEREGENEIARKLYKPSTSDMELQLNEASTKRHYCNVPRNEFHPFINLNSLSQSTTSLPPVSPKTPLYENINSQSQTTIFPFSKE